MEFECKWSTFVAWQWKANGGTTSSNTDGTINFYSTSNQDAGFSIVTYTGQMDTAEALDMVRRST